MNSNVNMGTQQNGDSKQNMELPIYLKTQANMDSQTNVNAQSNIEAQNNMNSQQKNGCIAAVEQPYPPIQPKNRRIDYGNAMLSNMAGSHSEMSTISTYFYNSTILNPDYADMALCFRNISIVEMHHLHIFASLASQMGLEPRLWSTRNRRRFYWTPAYNKYSKVPRQILQNAIQGEEIAIETYMHQAKIIQDANIVENLNRIILDEQLHVKLLKEMLKRI
ncbi:MAG: hypothetical protein K2M46_02655 [Lachnospiraceae bacterium]|nr:hypothetical protein [Lachnospiraceae bacterium]